MRGDADLMLRAVSSRVEPLHDFHVLLNQAAMRHAEITHSYLAATRPSCAIGAS